MDTHSLAFIKRMFHFTHDCTSYDHAEIIDGILHQVVIQQELLNVW